MSEKYYDQNGYLKYEITTGQSAQVYNPQGEIIGNKKDNGDIVTKSGTVIDNVGK